jgi:RNA polymerase sigma-70 factor (ECF subfamily)
MAISSVVPEAYTSVQDDLVRQAQEGNQAAFGSLIHGRMNHLYATAVLIVRNPELGQDAVQEALIRAWRDLPGLRDPGRLDAWLHRLLVRACYRVARTQRLRTVVEVPLSFDSDFMAPTRELDGVADRHDLERAFARLSQEHRAILVLAYYADLPLGDVAVALEIPVGTAKSRLSRATDAFRASAAADTRRETSREERAP